MDPLYQRRQSTSVLEVWPDSGLDRHLSLRQYRSNNEKDVIERFPREQTLLQTAGVSPRFLRRHVSRPYQPASLFSPDISLVPRLPPPVSGPLRRHTALPKTRISTVNSCIYNTQPTPSTQLNNEENIYEQIYTKGVNVSPLFLAQQNQSYQQTGTPFQQRKYSTGERYDPRTYKLQQDSLIRHINSSQPLQKHNSISIPYHCYDQKPSSSDNTYNNKSQNIPISANIIKPTRYGTSYSNTETGELYTKQFLHLPTDSEKDRISKVDTSNYTTAQPVKHNSVKMCLGDQITQDSDSLDHQPVSIASVSYNNNQVNSRSFLNDQKYSQSKQMTDSRSYKTLEELASEIHPRKSITDEERDTENFQSLFTKEAEENLGFDDDSSRFEKICQSSRSQLLSGYQNILAQHNRSDSKPKECPENEVFKEATSSLVAENKCVMKSEDKYSVEQLAPSVSSSAYSPNKISARQDSSVSSDSFSQNSSPSYTTKTMETPLLPHHGLSPKSGYLVKKTPTSCNPGIRMPDNFKYDNSSVSTGNTVMTKSMSTPASLQTFVKFQHGSNMSLQHRIMHDIPPKSSRCLDLRMQRFRVIQILVNVIVLVAIAGALSAYFKEYPETIRYINRTINITAVAIQVQEEINPSPGVCVPVIIEFCHLHHLPYNFTVFPNYFGHFSQIYAKQDIMSYDILVDVHCYELAALFLCMLFAPKCGSTGHLVRPCRELCIETQRRCGFFFGVFNLHFPEYITCDLFPEFPVNDSCVGYEEVKEARRRQTNFECKSGFECDVKRCIPSGWRCDGHVDCKDQSDELGCNYCPSGMLHCGKKHCVDQNRMCDGVFDCPWGQDERNCIRLSLQMGDEGYGQLQVFHPAKQNWQPACITEWHSASSTEAVCTFLGYSAANWSKIYIRGNATYNSSVSPVQSYEKRATLLKALRHCPSGHNPTVDISCLNYTCGVRKRSRFFKKTRIIGGGESQPGDWPFLAALLGGPEEIFYCAGVLISDQWVLTASHCVGNMTMLDTSEYTIQLGVTRRHAHSYFSQKAKVQRIIMHPDYDGSMAHDNDVALFQLKTKVTFHEQLLPVCLPSSSENVIPGTLCTVIGWGKKQDREDYRYEAALNEVEVQVIDRELCNAWLVKRELTITDGMMCAGYPEGGKDACQGDSGGPLLCHLESEKESWYVAGIVSWGVKCAHPQLPGIYANVPYYVDWIKEQIKYYG